MPFSSNLKAASLTWDGMSAVPESNLTSPPLSFVAVSVEFSLAIWAKSAPLAASNTSFALSSESNLIIWAVTSGV